MQATPAPPRQGLSRTSKWVLGCALGCATMLLIIVSVAIYLGYQFVSPGKQVPTEMVIGKESGGAVKFEPNPNDPGVSAMLDKVVQAMQKQQQQTREQLPPSLRWVEQFQQPQHGSGEGLKLFIPKDATFTIEFLPGEEEPHPMVAFNPKGFTKPLRMLMSAGGKKSEYRSHTIVQPDKETAFGFIDGTVVWSDSPAVIKRAIDRIESGQQPLQQKPALQPLYNRLKGKYDAYGVFSNEQGEFAKFLESQRKPGQQPAAKSKPPDALKQVKAVGFGMDVASADEVKGEVVLTCQDEASAKEAAKLLQPMRQQLAQEAKQKGLNLSFIGRQEGKEVIVDFRMTGLEKVIEREFSRMGERGNPHGK